jgi:hypothetical protein
LLVWEDIAVCNLWKNLAAIQAHSWS